MCITKCNNEEDEGPVDCARGLEEDSERGDDAKLLLKCCRDFQFFSYDPFDRPRAFEGCLKLKDIQDRIRMMDWVDNHQKNY